MEQTHDQFACEEAILLAGEFVPAGLYRDVETGRTVQLDRDAALRASFDGRVACYVLTSQHRVRITYQERSDPESHTTT